MSNAIKIQITADATDEEAAAAVAAIASLLAADSAPVEETAPRTARWRDAARLPSQGMTPTRTPASPGWGTIERIRRAGKNGSGITGM